MPRLEDWRIVEKNTSPYITPEGRVNKILQGHIYNDENERFEDGTLISTSTIQTINLKNKTVQTRNTFYTLGNISPEYQKWCKENNFDLSGENSQ